MTRTACSILGLAVLSWTPLFGQGNPAYVPPAFDTYTPNIPGVVAGGTRVQLITDTLNGTEGPLSLPGGELIFTEGGARRLTRIDSDGKLSSFLDGIQSSGLGFDQKGRLIANNGAEGKEGIYVVYPKGAEATLIDRRTSGFDRANDLVVDRKGGVYFTQPEPGNVWYIPPEGAHSRMVADNITRPNGITLSPDEKVLYVNDARGEYLLAYDVQPDGSVTNRRNFARYDQINHSSAFGDTGPGLRFRVTSCADGLAVDSAGRVYNAGCNGIQVYSPQGQHLGTIPTARVAQNLAFAGPDKKTLYLVGRNAAWKIQMLAQGYKGRAK
jgi:gluconolactonase